MSRFLRHTLVCLLAPVLIAGLWLLAALGLGAIPSGPTKPPASEGVEIALLSNGWHVDLALPVKAEGIDWSADFPASDTASAGTSPWILLGWGDRDFYLETPQLSDLKPGTAFNALLGRGPAVLHVVHLERLDEGPRLRRLKIGPETYQALAARLKDSARRDPAGRTILIPNQGFGHADAFYEAKGHYSPLVTCNEWLAAHLRAEGLPVGVWAPLPSGLTRDFE